jgi:hypothetical protein
LDNTMRRDMHVGWVTFLSAILLVTPPSTLAGPRDTAWRNGKSYTAARVRDAEAAIQAVQDALDRLKAAKDVLAQAEGLLTAAGGTAAASATATAAVAKAQSAVAIAQSAVVAAEAGAPYVVAAGVGAAAGTLIGQGLRGLWTIMFEDTAGTNPVDPRWRKPTIPEVELAAIQAVSRITAASGLNVDFQNTGTTGALAHDFISQGADMFISSARAAAAYNGGYYGDTLAAVADLQPQIVAYRDTVEQFGIELSGVELTSPAADILGQRALFEEALSELAATTDSGFTPQELSDLVAQLQGIYDSAQAAADDVPAGNLVGGPDALWDDLTLAEFQQFLADTASQGAAALPSEEVDIVNLLLAIAGVDVAGPATFADLLAAWDGEGDTMGQEAALFDPLTNTLSLADLFIGSATSLSTSGSWLDVNLNNAFITLDARANIPEPNSAILLAWATIAIYGTSRGQNCCTWGM